MRSLSCVVLVTLGLSTVGCGNLSKGKAREILQKQHYDNDNEVSCTWKEPVSQEGSGAAKRYTVTTPSDNLRLLDWMKALDSLGVIKSAECLDKWRGVCTKAMFELGPKGSVDGVRMSFPCGTKSLGEVTSVTTEGKTATVRYRRTVKLNPTTIGRLSDLAVDVPKEGEEELTRKFVKDDDGDWTDCSRSRWASVILA